MKLKPLPMLILFGTLILHGVPSTHAEGISIGNGAKINLDNGIINLNCMDFTIKGGGTLNMESGTIERCGYLVIDSGGIFIPGIGAINYCKRFLPSILLLLDD
jgi:hypothetical protein